MEPKYKVIFFDVDGTLITRRKDTKRMIHRMPSSAITTLEKLKENGILPVIASGRNRKDISELMADLHIHSCIAANGQNIFYQGKDIFSQFLDSKLAAEAIRQLMPIQDISITLETPTQNLFCKNFPSEPVDVSVTAPEDIAHLDIYEITVKGQDLRQKVQIHVPGLQVKMVGPIALNIFTENVSKATGIQKMLEILNISKEDAMAFGDEENDMEMFGAVGCAVAMGNGTEAIKNLAAYVTKDIDEDGIYYACRHFGLI